MSGLETDFCTRRNREPTRRRVRHDIMIGILEAARYGKLKTHIMKEVRLNFRQIQYYLSELSIKNFIEKEGNYYRTTEKGLNLVEACRICQELVEE